MGNKSAGTNGFKPGNTAASMANRARGRFITQAIIGKLQELTFDPDDKKKVKAQVTVLRALVNKLMAMALDGDIFAIKYVIDRVEGTPIATTVFKPEEDPAALAAQAEKLVDMRDRLASMTDEQRTAFYFQTLKKADGISGPSKSN